MTNEMSLDCADFFKELEIHEDVGNGHHYKAYLQQAVTDFVRLPDKQAAFNVYQAFFDCYRIRLEGESNPFLDLLDVLKSYEESAATLIDRQRDHFTHSVNVFLLGICVYSRNPSYQAAFNKKCAYENAYPTRHEEFFYRWGLASLFHDVGYPVEIIGRQINKFIGFVTDVDGDEVKVLAHLQFENFEELNAISKVLPGEAFTADYRARHGDCEGADLHKPIDLLAHKIHKDFNVNYKAIKEALDGFTEVMAQYGFIDHGYYSALVVLKWYGFLIQKCGYNPDYFFNPVLDSAAAILLHNYYRNALMKKPFSLSRLAPDTHPVAYLLILCDELQEWNREAYGILDKKRARADAAEIVVTAEEMDIAYIARKGALPEHFAAEKEALLYKVLDIEALFKNGLTVSCVTMDGIAPLIRRARSLPAPRPLLNHLEKLAVAIHDRYNEMKKRENPDEPLKYPTFSDLPDSMKYSNIRQARCMAENLDSAGYQMAPNQNDGSEVSTFSADEIEAMAENEHREWCKERIQSGWRYGKKKNEKRMISPYLVPYDALPEKIKEYDRAAIRSIPGLLQLIGMAVYQENEQQ